jgi:hypothetical protein
MRASVASGSPVFIMIAAWPHADRTDAYGWNLKGGDAPGRRPDRADNVVGCRVSGVGQTRAGE